MNKLILWNDMRLFAGTNPRATTKHSHPVVQLVLATQGFFLSKNKAGDWIEKKGLLIAPNYVHECDARNVPIITVDIDVDSSFGEWILTNRLKQDAIVDYPSEHLDSIDLERFGEHIEQENWEAIRSIIEHVFHFQREEELSSMDARIQRIVAFISQNIDQPITSQTLMDLTFLSESRLLHLFKEKMGLPIRNYILWYRLKVAFEQLLEGKSLTEAAYAAGFSDQAHMTRTCVKMIGVPPSIISKNSKFVQVSIPQ